MAKNEFIESLLALWREDLAGDNGRARASDQREPEILRRLASQAILSEIIQQAESLVAPSSPEEKLPHLDDEQLRAFVDGSLSPGEAERLKAHLGACMACFIRMAQLQKKLKDDAELHHTQAPAALAAKVRELVGISGPARETTPGQVTMPQERWWHDLIRIPQQFTAGLLDTLAPIAETSKNWLVAHRRVGFTAIGLAAAAVLLLMLLPREPIENDPLGGQLVIIDPGPLGFVNAQEVIAYPGMSVHLSASSDSLIFAWPAIPNALTYEISLLEEGKTKNSPFRVSGEVTEFSLPMANVKIGVRYVWELSGKLQDGRVFVARAAFVRRK